MRLLKAHAARSLLLAESAEQQHLLLILHHWLAAGDFGTHRIERKNVGLRRGCWCWFRYRDRYRRWDQERLRHLWQRFSLFNFRGFLLGGVERK